MLTIRSRRVWAGALALSLLSVAPSTVGVAAQDAAVPVSFMVSGDPAELAAYEAVVDAFEVANPDVKVNLTHIPGDAEYRQRMGADFAAGTPSDIVLINYRRFAPFAVRGLLEPLGPYLRQSDIIDEEDFYQETIDPFMWAGELACVPQNVSSLVVYYNKDLFDAAGVPYPAGDWTWDDFVSTARSLTTDLDGDGVTDQYGLGTEVSIFRAAPFIWQNGGELVDNLVEPHRLAVDSPAARQALQWFTDLQLVHHVAPDAVAEAAEDSESRFLNGRTAMYLNSRRPVPTFREMTGFEWDVAGLPSGKQSQTILHSDAFCMAAATRDKEAAWRFIEFANSVEGQTILAGTGRTVPSLRVVAESPAFLDPSVPPANSQVWLDVIPGIRGVPVLEGWVDIEEVAGEELERAFYGTATLDEALDSMITRTLPYFTGEEG